jgi:hypothetical protein
MLLSLAAWYGNEAVVRLLLKRKGFDADFVANELGQTTLLLKGHLEVVRPLMGKMLMEIPRTLTV